MLKKVILALFFLFIFAVSAFARTVEIKIPASKLGPLYDLQSKGYSRTFLGSLRNEKKSELNPSEYNRYRGSFYWLVFEKDEEHSKTVLVKRSGGKNTSYEKRELFLSQDHLELKVGESAEIVAVTYAKADPQNRVPAIVSNVDSTIAPIVQGQNGKYMVGGKKAGEYHAEVTNPLTKETRNVEIKVTEPTKTPPAQNIDEKAALHQAPSATDWMPDKSDLILLGIAVCLIVVSFFWKLEWWANIISRSIGYCRDGWRRLQEVAYETYAYITEKISKRKSGND